LTAIYLDRTLPYGSSHLPGETPGKRMYPQIGVASDRVCRAAQSPARRWALTSPFHPYRQSRRYISVALSLESPPAGVARYPALRSSDFPQVRPFGAAPAAVWLAREV